MSQGKRRLTITTVVDAQECAVLRVAGELDVHAERQFLDESGAVIAAGHRFLVLDLTALRFCDSRGLNCLLALEWLCRRMNGRLLLASLGVRVLHVLLVTRAVEALACFPTVGHALAAVPAEVRPAWPPGGGPADGDGRDTGDDDDVKAGDGDAHRSYDREQP
ncbi:anti-anti-sigma factor [Streptomyces griseoflavus]|uniref:STAS domain-containing protein n=1 Tax=Streptomyces TaxID=1883 RepID=UPI0004CBD836|nr:MULTISPECIES: STAS domain-containing protein [Streptomyces]KOG66200.1 anti-anti-sigma factor [Streptomyces griseoflavus]KOT86160.1 anti-anti-sigma factor [Streptomyces sp. NRRL F-5755]KWT62550.1 anti-anti-sigma factor [Streptomyces albus subsp. albus]